MRLLWIVFILCTVVSMGVLLIVVGQNQILPRLNEMSEKLQKKSEELYNERIDEESFKVILGNLLVQANKVKSDLEATVTKLHSEMEKKKIENDACQAEKKTKNDELSATEKEQTETEATLKPEFDAWKQEITKLRAQLTTRSPICDYVKETSQAKLLCPQ